MQPAAKAFYRSSMDSLRHARQHVEGITPLDASQVVLSLDYAMEMLLKAVLLEHGESVMEKPGRSVGLQQALKRAGTYRYGPTVEVLRERRDSLQHFASAIDSVTTHDLYEGVMLFVEELLRKDFAEELPSGLRFWNDVSPTAISAELLSPSGRLQRDVHAVESVVVWAETQETDSGLAVYSLISGEIAVRLTPLAEFEYMPRTDGERVAAYRQSGGVVVYELDGTRSLISETGGPTDIRFGFVAAQGLNIPDGLGGGIWLYSLESGLWDAVSESGDSARLTTDHVVWQEFDGSTMTVRRRPLLGGDTEVLRTGGGSPSPSGGILAWSTWPGPDTHIEVSDVNGTPLLTTTGILPHVDGSRLAFLRPNDTGFDLLVVDIESGRTALELRAVGFPTGGGPIVSGESVYFESRSNRDVHGIYRASLT